MQKIKGEKGITTIALVITIIIIAVISVPIAIKTSHLQQVKAFTNFKNDITNLDEAISSLYGPDGDISEIGPIYADLHSPTPDFLGRYNGSSESGESVRNGNDDHTYYIIDIKKLKRDLNSSVNMKLGDLNYGKTMLTEGYSTTEVYTGDTSDVYIINLKSRTIYYPDGKKCGNAVYYRIPEHYTTVG